GDRINAEIASATGTDGGAEKFAPKFAPTRCKRGQTGSCADKTAGENGPTVREESVVVRSCGDKSKGRLSSTDNRPSMSGREDLNLRPHGPEEWIHPRPNSSEAPEWQRLTSFRAFCKPSHS